MDCRIHRRRSVGRAVRAGVRERQSTAARSRCTDSEREPKYAERWRAALSGIYVCLRFVGVLTRRNVVIVLMSIELILNAVNLNLVTFSRLWGLHGQVFAIFVITDAAAEAAVGLGILIAFFRNKETVNVDEVDLLKW